MTAPLVPEVFTPVPQRTQGQADFDTNADSFLASLPGVATGMNLLAEYLDALALTVDSKAAQAAVSAAAALASQTVAAASELSALNSKDAAAASTLAAQASATAAAASQAIALAQANVATEAASFAANSASSALTSANAALASLDAALIAQTNAESAATSAQASEFQAEIFAQQAQQSAIAAINAPGSNATSLTSNTVDNVGNKTFSIQTGKAFVVGQFATIASTVSPENYMIAQILSHDTVLGQIVVKVISFGGMGTFSNWTIGLTAPFVSPPIFGVSDDVFKLVSRFDVIPDTETLTAMFKLIDKLKKSGVWQKLDLLYLPVFDTLGQSIYNWKDPSKFPLVPVGTIPFYPRLGFRGDSTTGFLETGFNVADRVNWTNSSTHLLGWVPCPKDQSFGSESNQAGNALIGQKAASSSWARLSVNDTGLLMNVRLNQGSTGLQTINVGTTQTMTGFSLASYVTGSLTGYRNGAALGPSVPVTFGGIATSANNLVLLRSVDTYSDYPLCAMSAGGALSAAEVAAYYSALREFLLFMGVPLAEPVDNPATKLADFVPYLARYNVREKPIADIDFRREDTENFHPWFSQEGTVGRWFVNRRGELQQTDGVRRYYEPFTNNFVGILNERTQAPLAPTGGRHFTDDLSDVSYTRVGVSAVFDTMDLAGIGRPNSVLTCDTGLSEHTATIGYTTTARWASFQFLVRKNEVSGTSQIAFEVTTRDGRTEKVIYRASTLNPVLGGKSTGVLEATIVPLSYQKHWMVLHMTVDLGTTGSGLIQSRIRFVDPARDPLDINYPLAFNNLTATSIRVLGWNFRISDTGPGRLYARQYFPVALVADPGQVTVSDGYTITLPDEFTASDEWTLVFDYQTISNSQENVSRIFRAEDALGNLVMDTVTFNHASLVGQSGLYVQPHAGTLNSVFPSTANFNPDRNQDFKLVVAWRKDRFYYGFNRNGVFNSESSDLVNITRKPKTIFIGRGNTTNRGQIAFKRVRIFDKLLTPSQMRRLVGSDDNVSPTTVIKMNKVYPELPVQPFWMDIARNLIGYAELSPGDNPEVLRHHQAGWTVFNRVSTVDSVDWCNHFVDWVMERCGLMAVGSIKASSYLYSSAVPISQPRYGAIVMINDVANDLSTEEEASGSITHIAFYAGEDPLNPNNFLMLGGNQSERVTMRSTAKNRIVAMRWPSYKQLVGFGDGGV